MENETIGKDDDDDDDDGTQNIKLLFNGFNNFFYRSTVTTNATIFKPQNGYFGHMLYLQYPCIRENSI